jgi:hypothetical protein
MRLVILHHLLNVFVQLANKKGFTKKKNLLTGCLDNVGSLTSHNPIGLQGLLRDSFTFFYVIINLRSLFFLFDTAIFIACVVSMDEGTQACNFKEYFQNQDERGGWNYVMRIIAIFNTHLALFLLIKLKGRGLALHVAFTETMRC